MKPYKLEIYLYAWSEEEIEDAKEAAREFVLYQYSNGNLVTASRFAEALRKFKTNPIIGKFLSN